VREFFDRESLAVAFLSLEVAFDLDAVRVSFLASFDFTACFLTSALRVGAGFFAAEDFRVWAERLPAASTRATTHVRINQAGRVAGYINFMFYLSRSKDFKDFLGRGLSRPAGLNIAFAEHCDLTKRDYNIQVKSDASSFDNCHNIF
jgi:hypothetical protein